MVVFSKIMPLAAALLFMTASAVAAGPDGSPAAEARRLILDGKADCVVVTGGEMRTGRGRGVSPLLAFHDRGAGVLRGATVVDKVIGRAAAAILISGGARSVHGLTMSADGKAYLEAHGIAASCDRLVPRILNADRTGLCPLEQAVAGKEKPEEALAALRLKIEELRAAAKRK